MSAEWKPGDVAMLRCGDRDCDATEHPGIFGKSDEWWLLDLGEYALSKDVEPWRPLVVIDPENREQVERLVDASLRASASRFGVSPSSTLPQMVEDLQTALREFADPTPPKPEEPTGLGAVVEDAEGNRWVRTFEQNDLDTRYGKESPGGWRMADFSGRYGAWDRIAAVRILSEGVTP